LGEGGRDFVVWRVESGEWRVESGEWRVDLIEKSTSSEATEATIVLQKRFRIMTLRSLLQHPMSRKVVVFTIAFFYFAWITRSAVNFFNARSIHTSGQLNTNCLQASIDAHATETTFSSSSSSPSPSPHPPPPSPPLSSSLDYCLGFPTRFSRFLLFETDSWAIKYAQKVIDHYRDHAVVYHIDVPGAKFSHAIYTSHLTGQPHTNYRGDPIVGDSLIKAMKRASAYRSSSPSSSSASSFVSQQQQRLISTTNNYSLRYVGPEWSFLAMVGPPEKYPESFDLIQIEPEPLDVHHRHPYPFFFESDVVSESLMASLTPSPQPQPPLPPSSSSSSSSTPSSSASTSSQQQQQPQQHLQPLTFFEYLSLMKKDGQSMVTHTGVFDHRQHGEHRHQGPAGKKFPYTDMMADTLQSDFKKLREWVDANPEYLLVLLSDHGVDEYGLAGYKLHGESARGNEPFMMVYNPTLEPSEEPFKIDVVDVCPTLALYLEGVDIPADSIGVSLPFFGKNNTHLVAKALKQTIAQQSKVSCFF